MGGGGGGELPIYKWKNSIETFDFVTAMTIVTNK